MAIDNGTRTGQKDTADAPARTGQERDAQATQKQQDDALQHRRRNPSDEEEQVRREQGGHDRLVGSDQVPQSRPEVKPGPGKQGDSAQQRDDNAGGPDPQAGLDREVGDLEDPNAEQDGALPGRAGGGLAGG